MTGSYYNYLVLFTYLLFSMNKRCEQTEIKEQQSEAAGVDYITMRTGTHLHTGEVGRSAQSSSFLDL